MSGTSFDGIDAAVADIELDGDELHAAAARRAQRALRRRAARGDRGRAAARADDAGDGVPARHPDRAGVRGARGARRSRRYGARADRLARPDRVPLRRDDAAGTLQLGQPAWIAERTGLPVVADLRARDVAAGGQGAPLVSLLDTLLLSGRPGTPAALNLGGIANLTVPPIAFDVGPANALLDAAARHFTGRPCDEDGRLAARGTVDRDAARPAARRTPTTRGPRPRRPARSTSTPATSAIDATAPRTCWRRSPA